ncbi:hypothetical protein BOTBODRAFT_114942 [Botryobasidium botryosum FD-172 SS1]|uniref:F-box domain-containing protein n=1 Tax=Botryobasidium botryosum (strain FD-172 SS1) TaxID=930990 RepID=A0A067MHL8_BOTB1|nr:hypothetical protein BOTBODRAFT_114942 [Botryobasidium botryosum FD-172 SS1]
MPNQSPLTLTALPVDILLLILRDLTVSSLAVLSRTCHSFHILINDAGWKQYANQNPRYSPSITRVAEIWSSRERARFAHLTDRRWDSQTYVARPLCDPWATKLRPVLCISDSRLVLAKGQELLLYDFGCDHSKPIQLPIVRYAGSAQLSNRTKDSRHDITGVIFLPDGGANRQLCVAQANGKLTRYEISAAVPGAPIEANRSSIAARSRNGYNAGRAPKILQATTMATYEHPLTPINYLTSSGNHILSIAASGLASLIQADSPWEPPSTIKLPFQLWSAHLSLKSSTPFAAIGTKGPSPLGVYPITQSQLSSEPLAFLGGSATPRSAVYGICGVCPGSPLGSSDQIVVSGWYDGRVRVHDLRCAPAPSGFDSSSGNDPLSTSFPAPLHPVMTLHDPRGSLAPIYCVATGGGGASQLVAGTAEHAVISVWDLRKPRGGWSFYPPEGDWSPSYSITLEGSKLWGTTQSRAFVLDFGPDVKEGTYPPVSHQDLSQTWDGLGYRTTTYFHYDSYSSSDGNV